MNDTDQKGSAAADDLCCEQFLDLFFNPLIIFHCNWVRFLGYSIRGTCINGHFCEWCCSYGCLYLLQIVRHIPPVGCLTWIQ